MTITDCGGCAGALILSTLSEKRFDNNTKSPIPLRNGDTGFESALREHRDAERNVAASVHIVDRQRHEIVREFAKLRDAIDTSERAALTQFDALAKQNLKFLECNVNAFSVKVWQLATCLVGGFAMSVNPSPPSPPLFPVLNFNGLSAFRDMLMGNTCWSIVNSVHCTDETVDRAQSKLLKDMQNFLAETRRVSTKSVMLRNISCNSDTLFQCHRLSAVCLEKDSFPDSVCDMTVSPDGKVIVVTGSKTELVSMFCVFTGKLLGSFRFFMKGKRLNVCFAPSLGTLMVSQRGGSWIYEVTLSGEVVRSVSRDMSASFCAIDVNSDAIVAVSNTGKLLHVYDFRSGTLIRKSGYIGDEAGILRNCRAVKFTADGTKVILAEDIARRLSIFTLTGEFVRYINTAMNSSPYQMCVIGSAGEIVVNGRSCVNEQGTMSVYSSSGQVKEKMTKFSTFALLCAVNNFLFVLDNGKLHVLW